MLINLQNMPQMAYVHTTSQGTSMKCGNDFASLKMGHKTPNKQSDIKHKRGTIYLYGVMFLLKCALESLVLGETNVSLSTSLQGLENKFQTTSP